MRMNSRLPYACRSLLPQEEFRESSRLKTAAEISFLPGLCFHKDTRANTCVLLSQQKMFGNKISSDKSSFLFRIISFLNDPGIGMI